MGKDAHNREQQYQQQQTNRVIKSKAIAARRTANQGHNELLPEQKIPLFILVSN